MFGKSCVFLLGVPLKALRNPTEKKNLLNFNSFHLLSQTSSTWDIFKFFCLTHTNICKVHHRKYWYYTLYGPFLILHPVILDALQIHHHTTCASVLLHVISPPFHLANTVSHSKPHSGDLPLQELLSYCQREKLPCLSQASRQR